MAYATCGNARCIVDEVQRVLGVRSNPRTVKPALAGVWGLARGNRPALEAQMDAIQRAAPQIETVSHWAFSWQDAEFDRERKFCESAAGRPNLENLRTNLLVAPEETIGQNPSQ